VCTEVMLRGYRVVEDMIEGLTQYMRDHGYADLDAMRGQAVPSYSEWGELNLNYETIAKIDMDEYGYCSSCGAEIGLRRLEARPTASLCIDCKTIEEVREKQVAK
jgi:RNA polymerase-binding transcription factor DksA